MPSVVARPINNRSLVLRSRTFSKFDGGLDLLSNDLTLDESYAKKLTNMFRSADGSVQVRYGTKLFAEYVSVLGAPAVGARYYNGRGIIVGRNGNIVGVDALGEVFMLWNEDIARARTLGVSGKWNECNYCSFAEFNGELYIVDGEHKPLIVPANFSIRYVVDIPTQSNSNTPVAPYIVTHGQFLVMAKDRTVYISHQNAGGTWFGDPATNNAVNVDLGSRLETGELGITGLASFRDKLIVMFQDAIVPGQLGVFQSTTHVPVFEDPIQQYGACAHNGIVTVGDDVLFPDFIGVPALSRTLFTGIITPDRVSTRVDPEIQRVIGRNTPESLAQRAFAILDRNESQFMLFLPNTANRDGQTEMRGFVYTFIKPLKVKAWHEVRGWNWRCAFRSALGKLFFVDDVNVYHYGSRADPHARDYIGYMETWDDGTPFSDGLGFTPVVDVNNSGMPIRFEWELPWDDFGMRDGQKQTKHIKLDTKGRARFTMEMYIDNIYDDGEDTGEEWSDETLFDDNFGWSWYDLDRPLDPTLSMEFVGGDRRGFGLETQQTEHGGGRIASDEREYSWPSKFKLAKLRMHGYAMEPLRVVSIGINYLGGTIRR